MTRLLAILALVCGCGDAVASGASLLTTCTSATIQAQLDATGRAVVDEDCTADVTITLPDRAHVTGRGRIVAGSLLSGPVFDASGTERALIHGIEIDGADVATAVYASGSERLALDSVTLRHGRPNGLHLDGAVRTSIRWTDALDCWNDGIAIRGQSEDTLILGGRMSGNGRDPIANGNGVDLNPGGKRARLIGVVTEDNDGGGVVVEGGPAALAAQWMATDVMLIGLDSRRNTGAGIEVVRKGAGPFPHRIVILGAVLADNGREGLYLLASGAVGAGVIAPGNQRYGLLLPSAARDVALSGVYLGGNGAAFGPSAAAAYLDGQRASVQMVSRRGVTEFLLDDAELDTGPQVYGVRSGPNARAVSVEGGL